MKISIRRKIIITISLFLILGGSLWFLNYNKYNLLNQKLRILEKKDQLFNTILEARRYEKNYFLYAESKTLEEALSYVRQAEQRLSAIIKNYGRFTFAKDLGKNLNDLRRYGNALSTLLDLHHKGESLKTNGDLAKIFSERQETIRALGKKITSDMEIILAQERRYVNQLVKESKIYHFSALSGIIVLSILFLLFLIFNVNRPLKSIEDAIHKIVAGDYTNIPTIASGDEFESLVTSLNNMISELNRRNEQLVQAEKLASLGTLTSGVAHELNNPLNNISTSVQILIEELEDAELEYKRDLLIETEAQVVRARDIVKALLEFSRERSFSRKQVRFKDLADDTIKLIKGELPTDVELKLEIPGDIEGSMDPQRIQQVLLNLILNAIQAMDDGGVVKIMASKLHDTGEFCFQVQDTGRGIPEENILKIFDPFFTTKETNKGTGSRSRAYQGIIEQQGSGLGLSVSHGIVEQHGGRIEVESKLAEGTTFSVYLPLEGRDGGTA